MPQLIFFEALGIVAYVGYRSFIREAERLTAKARRAEAEQRDERAQLGRAAEKREEGVFQIGTGPVVASRSERFERVDDVRLDAAVFGPAPRARDRGVALLATDMEVVDQHAVVCKHRRGSVQERCLRERRRADICFVENVHKNSVECLIRA